MPEALRLLVKEYGFFETTKAMAKVGEDLQAVAGQLARQRLEKQKNLLR